MKKKTIILIAVLLLVIGGGVTGVLFWMNKDSASEETLGKNQSYVYAR